MRARDRVMDQVGHPLLVLLPGVVVAAVTLIVLLVRAALEGRPAAIADIATALAVGVIVAVASWVLPALIARRAMRMAASVRFDAAGGARASDDDFELFEQSAQRVLTHAQDEADRLGHNWIGTEHLLLGILRDPESLPARVLIEHGVEVSRARTAIQRIVGLGSRPVAREVGLTPRSKRVIELAIREARRLGDRSVRAEHLLLGLLREGEGVAVAVLGSVGVDPDRVRDEVAQRRGEAGQDISGGDHGS